MEKLLSIFHWLQGQYETMMKEEFEATCKLEKVHEIHTDDSHLRNIGKSARRSIGLKEVMSINTPSPVSE